MQGFIDRKEAAGIVTLIARDGKVVDVHASGFQDVAAKTPMKTDTLFRIASMTKPVTSVAVMMLYEEGKLLLTDPVSKFIPAFKSSRVLEGAAEAPVAARRGINLRDLLSHRSGLAGASPCPRRPGARRADGRPGARRRARGWPAQRG